MDVRSASASLALVACLAATACVATSPRPLPPRHLQNPPSPGGQRPPDLRQPAEAPVEHERYLGWILAADLPSVIPLTYWAFYPEKVYYAAPSLLLPPLIHAAHGEGEKAAISLGLRALMLGGVYLAGRSIREECEDAALGCLPVPSLMLMNLAIVPVLLVDALFLARRERPAEGWRHLPVVPSVSATADGGRALVLSGHF